jgi:hypothetical protein
VERGDDPKKSETIGSEKFGTLLKEDSNSPEPTLAGTRNVNKMGLSCKLPIISSFIFENIL